MKERLPLVVTPPEYIASGIKNHKIAVAALVAKYSAGTPADSMPKAKTAATWDITYLKVDPLMDNLRADPRFADLVKRVGLQ